jgi:hypothetical protein
MQALIFLSLLVTSPLTFAQTDALKSKMVEVKKKGCPVVNGKEDCSAQEVKDKALEMKSKAMEAKKKLKP